MNGAIRVVLDTNVIVSGTAYPKGVHGKLLDLWRSGGLAVVLSPYLLTEIERVLPRVPSAAFNVEHVPQIVQAFRKLAEIVEPAEYVDPQLRDQADQPVLGTLIASGAAYLITGDKDLLALAHKYPVLTPAEFWLRHG